MRALAVALLVAAVAVPGALAKGRLTVAISDRTPHVGQAFTVTVRTGWVVPPNDWLRLLAAAPGTPWQKGDEIRLKRVAPKTWRASVRLRAPGRWRIVVPNGTRYGYLVDPPAAWMPWVTVLPRTRR